LPRGPAARLQAFVEERLPPSVASTRALAAANSPAVDLPASATRPQGEVEQLAAERLRQMAEYRTRLALQTPPASDTPPLPPASTRAMAPADATPVTPPGLAVNRWLSVGPQAVKANIYNRTTAYSGRVTGIDVAPGGKRLYIATANGGVWRSEDNGLTWQSLMDAFDLNPTAHQADSQACGAIALVAGEWTAQDLIYVGSGEANGALNAYNGVGPIVSHDGGSNWYTEPSEPSLLGMAFYALAVDPVAPMRVVAATTNGLYRREPDENGAYIWRQKVAGDFSSVVAVHGDVQTLFYAAEKYGNVYRSADGAEWTPLGKGFPTEAVGRIGLAVQDYNPNTVYALVATSTAQVGPNNLVLKEAYHLHGLYRLDVSEGNWQPVQGLPSTLFGIDLQRSGQGWYDLALAVAPDDVNRVYVGGAAVLSDGIHDEPNGGGEWAAALYRCEISYSRRTKRYTAKATYIGGAIHADVHALVFAPGDSNQLYVGCDGGVFYSTQPAADPEEPANQNGLFQPRNGGLATMTMNFLGLHPTEDAVFFCGTQDNGGLRYSGDELWQLSAGGDCGYCVINPRDPYHILTTYTYGSLTVHAMAVILRLTIRWQCRWWAMKPGGRSSTLRWSAHPMTQPTRRRQICWPLAATGSGSVNASVASCGGKMAPPGNMKPIGAPCLRESGSRISYRAPCVRWSLPMPTSSTPARSTAQFTALSARPTAGKRSICQRWLIRGVPLPPSPSIRPIPAATPSTPRLAATQPGRASGIMMDRSGNRARDRLMHRTSN
jgi:hypothetical protein